jgi:hypothetical protein
MRGALSRWCSCCPRVTSSPASTCPVTAAPPTFRMAQTTISSTLSSPYKRHQALPSKSHRLKYLLLAVYPLPLFWKAHWQIVFWLHCNENPIYVFLFWELSCLSSNFYIHVFMSDLCIPRIGPHISCSKIGKSIVGIYIEIAHRHVNVKNWDCGRANPFLGIFLLNFRYWFFAVWGKKDIPHFAGWGRNRTIQYNFTFVDILLKLTWPCVLFSQIEETFLKQCDQKPQSNRLWNGLYMAC